MRIVAGRDAAGMVATLAARGEQFGRVERQAKRIVDDVRRGGDPALRRYAVRWDGLKQKEPLRVSAREMDESWKSLAPELRSSLRAAAENIRQF